MPRQKLDNVVTKTVTVTIPVELHKQFKMCCAATDQSLTEAVTALMEEYVDRVYNKYILAARKELKDE